MDIRCEFGLGFLNTLETPSLLRQNSPEGVQVFCQCSMVHPTENGHNVLTVPTPPVSCTLIVKRCPLSQTIIP